MALSDTISALGTSILNLVNTKVATADAKEIISLSTSGAITLTNNSVHKVSAAGAITFTLPTGTTTNFGQMLVELYLPSVYTITLGTSYYFGGKSPDMSAAGYYTIIYEYDAVRGGWVVGVLKKATA